VSGKVNPNQFKMFMTAHEITAQYQGNDGDRHSTMHGEEDDSQMLTRKYQEAKSDPWLSKEILTHGVETPIALTQEYGSAGKPQIYNGMHRVALLAFEDRHKLMPVEHHEERGDAMEHGWSHHLDDLGDFPRSSDASSGYDFDSYKSSSHRGRSS
jgi:hypothetical protein